MGYCHRCGVYAALDTAAMCATCRRAWLPAAPAPGDLGYHAEGAYHAWPAEMLE